MRKKLYASPEVEIEPFFIKCGIITTSILDEDLGNGNTGSDFTGDGDWDF